MTGSVDNIRRFFKEAFTEKLELKLMAMIIAALLLALVRFQEETDQVVEVEILATGQSVSSQQVMISDLPKTVQVFLRGSRPRIDSLQKTGIKPVEINIANLPKGKTTHYFNADSFEIPSGIELVRVIPESVQITMDSITTRTVPVHIRMLGDLKAGAEMARKPSVEPKRVTVKGPASVVRQIKAVETDDVEIEGLGSGEHVRFVSARNIDGVNIVDANVFKVTMKIKWIPGQRTISDLPVKIEGTDLIVETDPEYVTLTVSGPEVDLEKLDQKTVTPFVALESEKGRKQGNLTGKVKVRGLPNNVKLTTVVPDEIQIRLTGEGETGKRKNLLKDQSR